MKKEREGRIKDSNVHNNEMIRKSTEIEKLKKEKNECKYQLELMKEEFDNLNEICNDLLKYN